MRQNVLIVDDDNQLRTSVAKNLVTSLDIEVFEAESVSEALSVLKKHTIHAILTDIKMPQTDGIEFLSLARSQGIKTPFIFITGNSDKEHVIRALRLGALDFIEKPFPKQTLVYAVKKALETHSISLAFRLKGFNLNSTRQKIAEFILEGLSNKEIASKINLSEQGIKYHVGKLLKKFSATDRNDLKNKLLQLI